MFPDQDLMDKTVLRPPQSKQLTAGGLAAGPAIATPANERNNKNQRDEKIFFHAALPLKCFEECASPVAILFQTIPPPFSP